MEQSNITDKAMIQDDIFLSTAYLDDMVWDLEYEDWITWWVSPLYSGYDDYISRINEIVEHFNDRNNECYIDFDRDYYECRDDMIEKCKITITKYEVGDDEAF
jgi:hypothetical protein